MWAQGTWEWVYQRWTQFRLRWNQKVAMETAHLRTSSDQGVWPAREWVCMCVCVCMCLCMNETCWTAWDAGLKNKDKKPKPPHWMIQRVGPLFLRGCVYFCNKSTVIRLQLSDHIVQIAKEHKMIMIDPNTCVSNELWSGFHFLSGRLFISWFISQGNKYGGWATSHFEALSLDYKQTLNDEEKLKPRNLVAFVIPCFFLVFYTFLIFHIPWVVECFFFFFNEMLLNALCLSKLDLCRPHCNIPPGTLIQFFTWEVFLYRYC